MQGKVREIWQLTWPQISMLMCQFFISFTDVWVAGKIGPDVQAAIGIITQCQMLLMSLVMAASTGAVASIAQALGAKKVIRAQRYTGLVVFGCFFLGGFLALLGFIFKNPFLQSIHTPKEMYGVASIFLQTYLLALPGQYILTIGSAVFRAAKSVYMPLYLTIAVCIVNLFFNTAFGLGLWGFPNYGAAGVAWATFVSVSFGGVCMLFLLIKKHWLTRNSILKWRWVKVGSIYLLQVAGPSLATSAIWQIGYLILFVITSTLPGENIIALAGLTAGMRIESILFLPGMAFGMTASILVGYALGIGQQVEARNILLTVLSIACVSMSLLGLIIWPWRLTLASFLSSDAQVIQEISNYLFYNILSVPFTIGSVVLAGGLNGAGASVYPMVVFSFATWCIRLPVAWYLGHILWKNASGVYSALLVSQIVQSIMLLWIVYKCNWTRFAFYKVKT